MQEDRINDWPFGPSRYWPVDRQIFEQLVKNLQRAPKTPDLFHTLSDSRHFSRIVLQARLKDLQLVDGRGFLELSDTTLRAGKRSIPLEPWNLWATVPRQAEGPATEIVGDSNGEQRLVLAPDFLNEPSRRLPLEWSLRGRQSPEGGLCFDFELPPCIGIEMLLDLPATLIPSSKVGLVTEIPLEEASPFTEPHRRWRIMPGQHFRSSINVAADTAIPSSQQQTTFQWAVRYTIAPQGLEVTATMELDAADAPANELLIDVETPLRITSILYGEQPVAWTPLDTTEQGIRIHVDLSSFERRETSSLVLQAMTALPQRESEKQGWILPRIRSASPQLFWKETRCGVHVLRPLQVRQLDALQAVQVMPRTTPDLSDREVFVFQFFDEDASLTLDMEQQRPKVTTTGASQIDWGNSEVRGQMVLDCDITEGQCYTLRFPVMPNWTIDSVKCPVRVSDAMNTPASDAMFSWDVVDLQANEQALLDGPLPPHSSRVLIVQMKKPLLPGGTRRLQVTGRFQAASRREFSLSSLLPLSLPPNNDTPHGIALRQWNSRYYLQQAPILNQERFSSQMEIDNADKLRHVRRYIDDASGNCFTLDTQGRDTLFVLEHLPPRYSSDIRGVATVHPQEIDIDFHIRCQPVDSSVDRVYVYFSPGHAADTDSERATDRGRWTWSSGTETVQPLQVRALPAQEIREMFPTLFSEPAQGSGDAPLQGEIWEIRLAAAQTGAFDLRAVASLPVVETLPLPLASLPLATSQRGEIFIESPGPFPYQIVNPRLKSIPIPSTEWFRYEETKAAFRYSPHEEPRLSRQSSLCLKRLPSNSLSPSAWVWSLRLDSQFEPGGTIKHYALFLVENRGKKKLRIRLPEGITTEDVQAVWRDDRRETWSPERQSPSDIFYAPGQSAGQENANSVPVEPPSNVPGDVVAVSLPDGSRFVTLSLEYGSREKPLLRQRNWKARYPSADAPILSAGWTAWFPPEFDLCSPKQGAGNALERQGSRQGSQLSYAMNQLLSGSIFDPLSRMDWDRLLHDGERIRNATAAAMLFFDRIIPDAEELSPPSSLENAFLQDAGPRRFVAGLIENNPTWGSCFGDKDHFANRMADLRSEEARAVEVRVLIDPKALALLGVFPGAPVPLPESRQEISPLSRSQAQSRGIDLFKQAGLILLVSTKDRPNKIREYTFYITASLAMSLSRHRHHRHDQATAIGPCVYFVRDADFLAPDSGNADEPAATLLDVPHWIPLDQWLRESSPPALPWSIAPQLVRLSSITPDWNAFEMTQDPDEGIVVSHRAGSVAYHWLAFLTTVLLASRKPLSHPAILALLLLLCELLARWVAPCHAGVPSGAFLGVLVALAFGMVRPRNLHLVAEHFKRRFPIGFASTANTKNDSIARSSHLSSLLVPAVLVTLLYHGPVSAQTPLPSLPISKKSVAAGTLPTQPSALPVTPVQKEAHRVFFPVDDQQRLVGNLVYVPDELLKLLEQQNKPTDPVANQNWSIAGAEYQGEILFNPLTQKLELANDFRVLLEIVLGSDNATIALPPLPLFRDRATWDGYPILPIWQTVPAGQDQSKLLVFRIENDSPGRHRLELSLAPPITRRGEPNANQVELAIPKITDATLRVKTTLETPPLVLHSGTGAVRVNSPTEPEFVARIGPVDTLAFSWSDEPERGESASINVEQRFNLLARPSQVEIWTTFAFYVDAGRIRHLDLLTDPHWQLSGQFRCDEYPVEAGEKQLHRLGPGGLRATQNEIVRLTFQEPVSGPVTIHAGFVLRNFNGVGVFRLPNFDTFNARTLNATLSIAADPLLEIFCPEVGLLEKSRAGWKSADEQKSASVRDLEQRSGFLQEGTPLAMYDLTKTEPSWTMAVRPRALPPQVEMTYSVRLEDGRSFLRSRADFVACGDVFQQRFSVPDALQIDSIVLRDSLGKPLDMRWTEQPDGQGNRTGVLFFRQAASGRFSITIDGTFATKAEPEQTLGTLPQSLPEPVLKNVHVSSRTLHVFRTATAIVQMQTDVAHWTPTETPLSATESIQSHTPATTRTLATLGSWKATADAVRLPNFLLRPNDPKVSGEQITVLSHQAGSEWEACIDFQGEITGGEMNTLRLRWDDQYAIRAVQPAMPWRLEQAEGAPVLVLTPTTPFAGKLHVRIHGSLNTSGTSVSVPKVEWEMDRDASVEVKRYLVLPWEIDGELIPWNLSMLEELEPGNISSLEASLAKNISESAAGSEPLKPFTPAADGSKIFLRVMSSDFSAIISRSSPLSVAELFDVSFVVKTDGSLFGLATVDLISRGQDRFILQMPPFYDMIEVASSGIAARGTKLPNNRWQINLWSSDYPQRLRILFRGSLGHENDKMPSTPLTLAKFHTQGVPCSISMPILENVTVRKTFWTITLDSALEGLQGRNGRPLDVAIIRKGASGTQRTEMGLHTPVSGSDAARSQCILNLRRLEHLLTVFEHVAALGTTRAEEILRWYSHWNREWQGILHSLELQAGRLQDLPPAAPHLSERQLVILDLAGVDSVESGLGNAASYFDATDIAQPLQALSVSYQNMVAKNFAMADSAYPPSPAEGRFTDSPTTVSQLQWRDHFTEDGVQLFGGVTGQLEKICLRSVPPAMPFSERLRGLLFPCFLLLLLPLCLRRFPLPELFLQCPHFWGGVAGLILWGLFPPGYIGTAILALTLFSLFFPLWPKHSDYFVQHP